MARFLILKEFQLLTWSINTLNLLSIKQFYICKLFICYAKYSNLTILREKRLYSFYMNFRIFTACTMTHIN